MAPIPLLSGAYTARSLIAGAQRCVNLYIEKMPTQDEKGEPSVRSTHFPTPGLKMLVQAVPKAAWRCLYTASNGKLYGVCGGKFYYINEKFELTLLGALKSSGLRRVSMADNGIEIVAVDGTEWGYHIDMESHVFTLIDDPSFVGADTIDYTDTYFVFNERRSQAFRASDSNSFTLDPLWIAEKTAKSDKLVAVIAIHREIWLIGELTTEVWSNVGAAEFPFQIINGAFIDHGCIAPQSIMSYGRQLFWLSRDKNGDALVAMAASYEAKRVSTRAIETELLKYEALDDAIGSIYQIEGHIFYRLYFPTADRTWVYDLVEDNWHEQVWTNKNGREFAHRVVVITNAYNRSIGGDRENGKLYDISHKYSDDDGSEIIRRRALPHIKNEGKLIEFKHLIAEMDCGNKTSDSQISLRWSNNFGKDWGSPVMQDLGRTGEYNRSVKWTRLGVGRNRVFELSWSGAVLTALNTVYVEAKPCLK